MVNDLLEFIDAEAKPVKMYRLGKFDKDREGARPMKVIFENHTQQQNVLNNLSKLKNANDTMKAMSIGYDMTQEERQATKDLVEDAKELDKKSPNYKHRVRGPPWKMEIVAFKKKD